MNNSSETCVRCNATIQFAYIHNNEFVCKTCFDALNTPVNMLTYVHAETCACAWCERNKQIHVEVMQRQRLYVMFCVRMQVEHMQRYNDVHAQMLNDVANATALNAHANYTVDVNANNVFHEHYTYNVGTYTLRSQFDVMSKHMQYRVAYSILHSKLAYAIERDVLDVTSMQTYEQMRNVDASHVPYDTMIPVEQMLYNDVVLTHTNSDNSDNSDNSNNEQ